MKKLIVLLAMASVMCVPRVCYALQPLTLVPLDKIVELYELRVDFEKSAEKLDSIMNDLRVIEKSKAARADSREVDMDAAVDRMEEMIVGQIRLTVEQVRIACFGISSTLSGYEYVLYEPKEFLNFKHYKTHVIETLTTFKHNTIDKTIRWLQRLYGSGMFSNDQATLIKIDKALDIIRTSLLPSLENAIKLVESHKLTESKKQ